MDKRQTEAQEHGRVLSEWKRIEWDSREELE